MAFLSAAALLSLLCLIEGKFGKSIEPFVAELAALCG